MIYVFTERVTTSHAFGTMAAWIEEGDTYIYLYIRSRNTRVGFGTNGWDLGLTIIE